jgi:hypothetical protein
MVVICRVGKNTYSKTPNSSGCSEYLERRVVQGMPYVGVGLGAQSFSRHTLAYKFVPHVIFFSFFLLYIMQDTLC